MNHLFICYKHYPPSQGHANEAHVELEEAECTVIDQKQLTYLKEKIELHLAEDDIDTGSK